MWRTATALLLAIVFPASASAGPIAEAAKKAGRELALAEAKQETKNRGRFWTGIALIAGGGTLAALSALEIGDDETGPDDGEDFNDSDDGEDSDGWGGKALAGGGVAAAALGAFLVFTGRGSAAPSVSVRPGRVTVRKSVKF
jgi:hypothetical protein